MTQPIARDPIYLRRRFDREIVELCVRWYVTYRLSYRDLVALMAERGVTVSHTTILRWVIHYVPEFEKRWNRRARPTHSSWRVDETYVQVRGRGHYRTTCIGPSIILARPSTFCSGRIAGLTTRNPFFARHLERTELATDHHPRRKPRQPLCTSVAAPRELSMEKRARPVVPVSEQYR